MSSGIEGYVIVRQNERRTETYMGVIPPIAGNFTIAWSYALGNTEIDRKSEGVNGYKNGKKPFRVKRTCPSCYVSFYTRKHSPTQREEAGVGEDSLRR